MLSHYPEIQYSGGLYLQMLCEKWLDVLLSNLGDWIGMFDIRLKQLASVETDEYGAQPFAIFLALRLTGWL